MTLRLIVRTDDGNMAAQIGGGVLVQYRTFDVDLPEVEAFLRAGGSNSGNDYSFRQLVGAEVVTPPLPDDDLARTAGI